MNKQEILDIAKILGDKAAPQLRSYAYVDWLGWAIFFAVAGIALMLIWNRRHRINEAFEEFPVGDIALGIVGFATGMLLCPFIPYTLHVLATPELEGLKSLLQSIK